MAAMLSERACTFAVVSATVQSAWPSEYTRARVVSGVAISTPAAGRPSRFVGRERELSALGEALYIEPSSREARAA